jgi:hypothetical protein
MAVEMMGPALNISIHCLQSEIDFKESKKKHMANDLDSMTADENTENSAEVESKSINVDTGNGTANTPPRANSHKIASIMPPIPEQESSNRGESSRTVHPFRNDEQLHQELNLKNVPITIKDKALKIVTILDFGGQSAYYACHSVYFSPRAFHILVIDMSKDLHSRAGKAACETPGLIYSEWKYLGIHV